MKNETIYLSTNGAKAQNPATYKQVKFLASLADEVNTSTSQMMKRLEMEEVSEAIDAALNGAKIVIE